MSVPSTPPPSRLARPAPFTPNRPASVASGSIEGNRFPRSSATPAMLGSAKKFKATLSTETRTRLNSSRSRPGSPTKRSPLDQVTPRPKTPSTPRREESPAISEMDVSRIDPEEVLVDFQNIEAGDISAEIDEAMLKDAVSNDKVLVSIRVRPSDSPSIWETTKQDIKIGPQNGKAGQEFHFDNILTGSENKPVYTSVARNHVYAAMDGYNSVIFAYGQTCSGKTYTLSGDPEEPGIIPRAMKDVFAYIRRTPTREYLLRCSYLEIYNETIHDLLAPPSTSAAQPVQIHGTGPNIVLSPMREEVVTSLKSVKEVLARGEGNRRTASTDWNERSSRSHSVFRVVIESRERGSGSETNGTSSGRQTPGFRPPTPGGARLQARGGRSVQTSVLSLIDLAGSEKATSDKERTREGKYINTSLLTLGSVISTLAENSAKHKANSKLTRMLQPSLSGDARISVVCTINPSKDAIGETTSTLLFAQRIKKVQLHAQKREIVDTDALLERYRKEIEELKERLAEREAEAPARTRRLSAREQLDESRAMNDLNARIRQLTKLILTSQTVDETRGDESRPASPVKIDFDMSPYQLQQELLAARRAIETQATQILSLEAALLARPVLPPDAPECEKDKMLSDQAKTIRELEIVVKGYEDNLGEPLRKVKEDVEREWMLKVDKEVKLREEKEAWADVLVKQLEKEKRARQKLEEERQALAAFVKKFDALGLGSSLSLPPHSHSLPLPKTKLNPPMPTPGGAAALFAERQRHRLQSSDPDPNSLRERGERETDSPMRVAVPFAAEPSLLEEEWDAMNEHDVSFEAEKVPASPLKSVVSLKGPQSPIREVFGEKENIPVS